LIFHGLDTIPAYLLIAELAVLTKALKFKSFILCEYNL